MKIPCLTFGYFIVIIILLSIFLYPVLRMILGAALGDGLSSIVGLVVFGVWMYSAFGDRPECKIVGNV